MPLVIAGDNGESEQVKTCPLKLIRGLDVWDVIQLYSDCEMMHALPEPGGVLGQPRKLMQAFRLIRTEVNKHKDAERNCGREP